MCAGDAEGIDADEGEAFVVVKGSCGSNGEQLLAIRRDRRVVVPTACGGAASGRDLCQGSASDGNREDGIGAVVRGPEEDPLSVRGEVGVERTFGQSSEEPVARWSWRDGSDLVGSVRVAAYGDGAERDRPVAVPGARMVAAAARAETVSNVTALSGRMIALALAIVRVADRCT